MSAYFVDVWHGNLICDEGRLTQLRRWLSDVEHERATAFSSAEARARFVAGRGTLRAILADYLQCEPPSVQFELSQHGKPFLAERTLSFNVSHSGNCWVLAVSNLETVGVDVELVRSRGSLDGIARRCFGDDELECWLRLPTDERQRAFYRLWTIKEALVKAVGRGIALGLQRCEVDTTDYAGFSALPAECGPASAWRAQALALGDEVCAALVIPSRDYAFRCLPIRPELFRSDSGFPSCPSKSLPA